MLISRFRFRVLLSVPVLMWCFSAIPAAAQGPSQKTEIETLRKQVVDQGKRIAALELEVHALLSAREEPHPIHSDHSHPSAVTEESATCVSVRKQAAASSPSVVPVRASGPEPVTAARSIVSDLTKRGVNLGGDVYLFQYVPYGVPGARPKFELYALSLQLQGRKGPWLFYGDYRFRTTKLRSFYPGNTWLQQAYVGYRTPLGIIKTGSFYRRVGLEWDGSFFGNIQYFDGLKLDPEFGVSFEGSHRLAGNLGAEYSVQYFTDDARINGSEPGRDFVSEPGAHAKNDVTVRFAPVWHFNDNLSLTVGGSYARGTIDRVAGPHNTRSQVAGDATLQWRGLITYAEVLNQHVEGVVIEAPQDATYTLFGTRWARGRFQPRFNFSAANYHGFHPRREYIIQPGITVLLADGFSFLYEFDYWKRTSISTPLLLDKSLNFVLLYHF